MIGKGPASEGYAPVRSEDEVAARVLAVRKRGGRIRAQGSGGSKSQVTSTPDETLPLELGNQLIHVDGPLVTAPASMTSARLQDLLAEIGLVLPTVGEWRNATLGGALATGTHGGSAHHGIMASSLRRVRLVTGEGTVVEVEPESADFQHVAVSLGALGVLTSVTFECEPRFSLEMVTDVVPFDQYLLDPAGQESRMEFHASVWIPSARRVIRFGATRVAAPQRPSRRRARFGKWTAMASFVARRLGWHRAVDSRLLRSRSVADAADILSPLDVSPGLARFRNRSNGVRGRRAAELAVPAIDAAETLARFDRFFARHASALNNPIGLRLSAADDFSMSPCQGRATLWMDVFHDDDPEFVSGLSELGQAVDARCHWGKALALPAGYLRASYPGWADFRNARRRLDPDQVFANDFTDQLGLTDGGKRPLPPAAG